MPRRIVREAKAAAARRGATLATIVSDALERAVAAADTEAGDDLKESMRWFQANRARLERYRGEYLAIVDLAVVDHDRRFEALAERVFARFGVRPVFMPRVVAGKARVRVRSPRITRR